MTLSYPQLLADVFRYRYLCDEGFSVELNRQYQMSWEDARAMERLAERIVSDTGMNWTLAMRGILYSVTTRNVLRRGVFAGIVACPAST